MSYISREYVPSARQMFVLNRGSYISSLGTTRQPLTISRAITLLRKLEIAYIENTLGLRTD